MDLTTKSIISRSGTVNLTAKDLDTDWREMCSHCKNCKEVKAEVLIRFSEKLSNGYKWTEHYIYK